MSNSVRYPAQFETSRLQALGDPPYLEPDDARKRYAEGKSLRVVADGNPPEWFLLVSPNRHRFTLTFYAPTGTPIREVAWEADGVGLFCRRIIDLFYPDGDPGGRVPYAQVLSVTQHVSTDGVIEVTMASPVGDDAFHEAKLNSVDRYRGAVPGFGDWCALLVASAPPALERFGPHAPDSAKEAADNGVGREGDGAAARPAHWRVSSSVDDIMRAVDAITAGAPTATAVPVLSRGAAHVLPLALRRNGDDDRSADEQRRRMDVLAGEIRDACEHRAGQGIPVGLDGSDDSLGSYAAALRAEDASEATSWEFGSTNAVVLVRQRDHGDGVSDALSVHVVPAGWLSPRRDAPAVGSVNVGWSWKDISDQRAGADT